MFRFLSQKTFQRIARLIPGVIAISCSPAGQEEAAGTGTAVEERLMEEPPGLQVAVVYNESDLQLRFRFATDHPIWYHQYWVYQDAEWTRLGSGAEGPDEHGLYEDRVSVMWDDGAVKNFALLGGHVTAHPGMRSTAAPAPSAEVRGHPHLGGRLGQSDVRKFIPESREADATPEEAWRRVRSPEELEKLREAGVFLDLWQWRAHRSHPVGHADNGYILEYRHPSPGRSMYFTNQDTETGLPLMMFDPEKSGFPALRLEKLLKRAYGQEDRYYLTEDFAVPFDPGHAWKEGDAIPHRILRRPDGSRGAIRAAGGYEDGAWRIRLTRSLESPDPLDSKTFVPGQVYHAAFAVHSGGTGVRHHWVSHPVNVGFGTDADIKATQIDGNLDEAEPAYTTLTLFLPKSP